MAKRVAASIQAGGGGRTIVNEEDEAGHSAASEKEELLASVIAAGTFDIRGTVGGWWTKALKTNAELSAQYKHLGRSYALQREFRQRWADKMLKTLRHEKIQVSEQIDISGMDGTYKPIRVIIRDEGDDSSAIEAAFNIVAKCLHMHNIGETSKGKP